MKTLSTLLAATALLTGCAVARTPEVYRDDTKRLLDGRSAAIKACYDGVLKTNDRAAGKVTVKFAFEKKTGNLVEAEVDSGNTTAPGPVGRCVLSSINGLTLDPGDRNRGEAVWSWEFSAAAEK